MNMQQSIIKIAFLAIALFGNSLSFGMLSPYLPKVEPLRYGPEYIEGLFVKSQTDNIPLRNVLTPMQLLVLAEKRFNASMPQPPLQCDVLYGSHNAMSLQKYSIDRLQEERTRIFLALPRSDAIKAIHTQFQQIAQRLADDEYAAWDDFVSASAKKYGFDRAFIPSYSALKQRCSVLLAQKQTTGIWDNRLPQLWRTYLAQAMAENGIDPTNVNIFPSHDDDYGKYIAMCSGPFTNAPAVIALNKKQYKTHYSIPEEKSLKHTAYHEVTHLLCGHTVLRMETFTAIIKADNDARRLNGYNTPIDISIWKENIQASPAYTSFILAMERSADSLLALKNAEIASLGRWHGSLYSGSYNYLATADTNWQMLGLIQKDLVSAKNS